MPTLELYTVSITAVDAVGNPSVATTVTLVAIATGTPPPVLLGVSEDGGSIVTVEFTVTYTLVQVYSRTGESNRHQLHDNVFVYSWQFGAKGVHARKSARVVIGGK
jgi:uncharacterized protein (DUF302 family)